MSRILYKITHVETGRAYIGQTVNFKDRMRHHITAKCRPTPIHLAIKKYGIENFSFEN